MTTILELSPQQQSILDRRGSVYVEACPGAGKTRTLVRRAIQVAEGLAPTRGVALLSFTKATASEFMEKLAQLGATSMFRGPSYVGTIDSFLWRYTTLPLGNPWARNTSIRLLQDWKPFTISVSLDDGDKRCPVTLSAFDVELNVRAKKITATMNLHSVGRFHGRPLEATLAKISTESRAKAERAAERRLANLLQRGYMSPRESRILSESTLRSDDSRSVAHVRNLSRRFEHIIVDEAQDCSSGLLQALERLHRAGTNLTLIADPNQAIYGWRGASPEGLATLVSKWEPGPKLTGNYRSSPNICKAAATLRPGGQVDDPIGENAAVAWPIYVIAVQPRAPAEVGARFVALLDHHGVACEGAISLAHRSTDACSVVVNKGKEPRQRLGGRLRTVCLAARRRFEPTAISRVQADVETYLEKRWGPELREALEEQRYSAEARRITCEVLATDPAHEHWHKHALRALESVESMGLKPAKTAGNCLPRPSTSLDPVIEQPATLRWSTVHQAKGLEYDAVLLTIGRQNDPRTRALLATWRARRATDGEDLSVIYVGITRARRLLAVAAPRASVDEVCDLLSGEGAAVAVWT